MQHTTGSAAYDLQDKSGEVGNEFMNAMQPLISRIPMNAGVGNHEKGDANDFEQFLGRFRGLSQTAGLYSKSNTSLWYSFNDGPVHWISIDTELWPYNQPVAMKDAMMTWLAADLAGVSRVLTPWIFVFGHRQQWMDGPNAWWAAIDDLLVQYGVQLGLWGHEHQYQRLFE